MLLDNEFLEPPHRSHHVVKELRDRDYSGTLTTQDPRQRSCIRPVTQCINNI